MTKSPGAERLMLTPDPHGSVIHVRLRETGECFGCVEAGLFELLKDLILAGQYCRIETKAQQPEVQRDFAGSDKQRPHKQRLRE